MASSTLASGSERHVFGGHAPGRRVFAEGHQLGDFGALLRLHLGQDFLRVIGMHVAEHIGSGIGIHLLHDVGGAVGVERTENRNLHLGVDLFQRLGGDFFVERLEDGFALGRSKVFDDVSNVGRVQFRQAVERNLQLDPARRIGLDKINEFPRDHPRRNFGQSSLQRRGGNHAFQQPADGAARAHIHRAKLENDVLVANLLVDVDVVDPHDFAAVNVDDLLVEQVALQQEHAFAAAVRRPLRGGGGDPHAAVDRTDARWEAAGGRRGGSSPQRRRCWLEFSCGDNVTSRTLPAMRARVVEDRRANQFGKCE